MSNKEALLERARSHLLYYICYMMPTYEVAKHHVLLCNKIMEVISAKESRYLMVSMPPRHGKSTIVSEFLPSFYMGWHKAKSLVITASYGASLAASFGKKVRRHIASDEYKFLFEDVRLRSELGVAGDYFELMDGSEYRAVGRGGSITGHGSTLTIIDDIIKDSKEAASATIRKQLKEWYDSTMETRTMPGGKIIIVSTRWHEDDLQGYLLSNPDEAGKWEVINLEALCEHPEDDLLGRRVGEALWPEWYNEEYLLRRKARNPYQFSALYQGRPSAKQGNMCNSDWIIYANPMPTKYDCKVLSMDTSSLTYAHSCYNAGIIFGTRHDKAYVTDMLHAKLEFPDLLDATKKLIAKHLPAYVLIENASSGIQLLQMLSTDTLIIGNGIHLVPISKQTDKLVLFRGILPLIRDGHLLLPEGEFDGFEKELLAYPYSSFTDRTIALIQFMQWWRLTTKGFTQRLQGTTKHLGWFNTVANDTALYKPTNISLFQKTGSRKGSFTRAKLIKPRF